MKTITYFMFLGLYLLLLNSCTKTESDFTPVVPETITLSSSTINIAVGSSVTFIVSSSAGNANVTANSKIFVNGSLITGNTYTFTAAGNFAVYATKGAATSNIITINATPVATTATTYKHKVLVEEYSGTWCGNCPRILYGVDLLEQQTQKAIVVGVHLFNNDPFITTDGNNLAAARGVTGVPTGYINRTTVWTGPQYENVPQVINTINASANAGLSISSVKNNSNLNVEIKVSYGLPLAGTAKLTVYLVEDKLMYTQSNYAANLYNGQASIPNFMYNGVLRTVVSTIGGDDIAASGKNNSKSYQLTLPTNITNIDNARVVAFITDTNGKVINVQDAIVGQIKDFEPL